MSDNKEGLLISISLYSTCPTLLVSASAKNAYTLATDGDELFSTRFTNPFVETWGKFSIITSMQQIHF